MNALASAHGNWIFPRRIRVLAEHLAAALPTNATVLDVGCGNGSIARQIQSLRPDVTITGVEYQPRPDCLIPAQPFDGRHLPFPDQQFTAVLLVDVLHHAEAPDELLKECARVAQIVLVKDHFEEGWLARPTLRLMDWVGNARYGVSIPERYWNKAEWAQAWQQAGLKVVNTKTELGLYPAPLKWVFERSLHFVTVLKSG